MVESAPAQLLLLLLSIFTIAACGQRDCAALMLDPTSFGGYNKPDVDAGTPVAEYCTAETIQVSGSWSQINHVRGSRTVNDGEWFGISGAGQVGVGVSLSREPAGGIRFDENTVGVYMDSKRTYWGAAETPTAGGLNQDFSSQLVEASSGGRGAGFWLSVDYAANQLNMAYPNKETISFTLPDSFKGKKLYPLVQVWNSKKLSLLVDLPGPHHECSSEMVLVPRTLAGHNANDNPADWVTATSLKVEGGGWNGANSAKMGNVLKAGQWIGALPVNGNQIGVGVSVTSFAEEGIRFSESSVGVYLDSRRTYYGKAETPTAGGLNKSFSGRLVSDPKGRDGLWIMVDYGRNLLWLAYPNSKPISVELPSSFKGKALFPHYQVWNNKSLAVLYDSSLFSPFVI